MDARTRGAVLMVQGTASHVGKSTLVAALCRIFTRDGYRVAPFKAQNMSLNAAVTPDGGEIGRAQYTQAEAAGVVPSVRMNPILLKPTTNRCSQVVVLGQPIATEPAVEYYARRAALWPAVTESLDALRSEFDLVVIEGAGSPAEINLAEYDIVNMRIARHADAPVVLVGDIERGGVFAALYGTVMLLPAEDRPRIGGFVINKFRGDPTLLGAGPRMLESRTGIPSLGVLPYTADLGLPEEDTLGLDSNGAGSAASSAVVVDIAAIRFPHTSNFDDLDPLRREAGVRVRWAAAVAELGEPDLIVLPGTKTTASDLAWLRSAGLADAIVARRRVGTVVLGICGGFQMLGNEIADPDRVESATPVVPGLGLLPAVTTFAQTKSTHQVRGRVASTTGVLARAAGSAVSGYEIHMGQTVATAPVAPAFTVELRDGRTVAEPDGMLDSQGRTLGTYMHGLFEESAFRRAFLSQIAASRGRACSFGPPLPSREVAFDALADLVAAHLDLGAVYRLAGLPCAR
jgi:adenosylcobyric acid synthase